MINKDRKPDSNNGPGIKGIKNIVFCFGLAGMGLAAFFSLRSSPALNSINWMPRGIAQWADTHGRFDNFPAFGLVGLPFFLITSGFFRQLSILGLLALFIIILELAQLSLPARHCDAWDVFWGSLGLVSAWGIAYGLKRIMTFILSGSRPAIAP